MGTYEVIQETASLMTRDGVRLDADIYRPQTHEKLPVLLMRQPYGRSIASTVVYAHPSWYAAQGYIVVIQDVRGRGTSAGPFKLFAHEVDDGEETVNWAAQLAGSNGTIGMYGFSYQGMTQLYAASRKPAVLKTIVPAMIGYDLYQDWAYEGGAFCLQASLGWAIQLAAETARLKGDAGAFQELYQAARHLPLHEPITSQPQILQRLAPDSFYHDWVNRPEPTDPYWQCLHPVMEGVDLPMLHIGGWFDLYLRGTLRFYQEMAARASTLQHLWIGPWTHLPWGRQAGAIDYGVGAVNPIDTLQLRWFNHFLKGIDTGLLHDAPIHLFEMGRNAWRTFTTWPTEPNTVYFLASTGLAAMREDDGKLITDASSFKSPDYATDKKSSIPVDASNPDLFNASLANSPCFALTPDTLVHDPWRPVPALGGHAAFPAGAFDRRAIDDRNDVLTYTTAPLQSALHIVGPIKVEIFCDSSTPSFDLCAVLSEVRPNGVFNFSQGYRRIERWSLTQLTSITVQLQPTCIKILPGYALRLSLSAACFPAYAVNPGTGKNPNWSRSIEAQVTTLTVFTGPSRVNLHIEHR